MLLAVVSFASASAQTLAHPGWVGNGMNNDSWWQHAVFYRVRDAEPDFNALAARLESIRALGVDALLLPAPEIPAQSGMTTGLPRASPTYNAAGSPRRWTPWIEPCP